MTKLQIVCVFFILVLGLFLRFHNYAEYPQRGATSDEYTYSFLGISLITKQIPISWSFFSDKYPHKFDLTINKIYFPMVSPYFDHPPLHGLSVGSLALLFGQDTFQKVTLDTIRLHSIILATISSVLVFLIGRLLYGYKIGLWALLIFSTVTIFVMNMRVVVAENLISVFLLSALYIFLKYKKNFTYKKATLVGILCGLCLLTKIVGGAVFVIFFYLLYKEKIKPKIIGVFTASFLFMTGLLLGYAFYFDWNLFWTIQAEQGARNIGPQSLLLILHQPVIVNKIFYDNWYYLGFFSIFLGMTNLQKNKYIVIPSLIYLVALLASINNNGISGWYTIPLYPFMAIATANLLSYAMEKAQSLFFVFIIFIGLSEIHLLVEEPFGLTNTRYRILLLILFVPLFILLGNSNSQLFRRVATFWFYLCILGNIVITYNYIHPA